MSDDGGGIMAVSVERQRRAAERYMLTVRASFVALLLSFVSHEISDSESIALCHFILGLSLTIQLAWIALSRRVGPIAAHRWARAEDSRYGAWHQVIATPFDLIWRALLLVAVGVAGTVACGLVRYLWGPL